VKPLQPDEIGAAEGYASDELAEYGGLPYPNSEVSGQFCRDENDGKSKNDARNRICVTAGVRLSTDDGGQEQN
jgi:hypothetical protein